MSSARRDWVSVVQAWPLGMLWTGYSVGNKVILDYRILAQSLPRVRRQPARSRREEALSCPLSNHGRACHQASTSSISTVLEERHMYSAAARCQKRSGSTRLRPLPFAADCSRFYQSGHGFVTRTSDKPGCSSYKSHTVWWARRTDVCKAPCNTKRTINELSASVSSGAEVLLESLQKACTRWLLACLTMTPWGTPRGPTPSPCASWRGPTTVGERPAGAETGPCEPVALQSLMQRDWRGQAVIDFSDSVDDWRCSYDVVFATLALLLQVACAQLSGLPVAVKLCNVVKPQAKLGKQSVPLEEANSMDSSRQRSSTRSYTKISAGARTPILNVMSPSVWARSSQAE